MNKKEKIMNLQRQTLKCEKCGNWKIITNLVGIPDSGGVYDIHLLCECLTCNCTSRVLFGDEDGFYIRAPWNRPPQVAVAD